jgi:hypothetical protein
MYVIYVRAWLERNSHTPSDARIIIESSVVIV